MPSERVGDSERNGERVDAEFLARAKKIAPFTMDSNGSVNLNADNAKAHVDIDILLLEILRRFGLNQTADYIERASEDFWYE